MEYINIKYSQMDNQVRTDTNFHRAKKSSQECISICQEPQQIGDSLEWNERLYKFFKMMRSMEKVKHLEPKFSYAIERLCRKIKRQNTKTAGRIAYKAKNEDKTTENNQDFDFDHERSISQDKTEFYAKQSEFVHDVFDAANYNYTDNDQENMIKHNHANSTSYPQIFDHGIDSKELLNFKNNIQSENKRMDTNKPQICNNSIQNFTIHQQPDAEVSESKDSQRQEVINILRSNSKILLQNDKNQSIAASRLLAEENSKSQYIINNTKEPSSENRLNSKIPDLKGSKEYNDSRYNSKNQKISRSNYSNSNSRDITIVNGKDNKLLASSLHGSLSEPHEENRTSSGYKMSRTRSYKANEIMDSNNSKNPQSIETNTRFDFNRPQTDFKSLIAHNKENKARR